MMPLLAARARQNHMQQGFDPVSLFSGEGGLVLDMSNAATRFQDRAGTIPAAIGDPLGKLLDRSPNADHVTAWKDSGRPIVTEVNGKVCARFDGIDDGLVSMLSDMSATDQLTFVIAAEVHGSSINVVVEYSQNAYVGREGFYLSANETGANIHDMATPGQGVLALDNAPPARAVTMMVCDLTKYDDTEAGMRAGTIIRVDGTVAPWSVMSGSLSNGGATLGQHKLHIGMRSGGQVPAQVDVYGIVGINRLLTTTERGQLNQWAAELMP